MSDLNGKTVKVVRCDLCPNVVGKLATVKDVGENGARLSFGRGRPQKNRPEFFNTQDLEVVNAA